MHSDPMINNNTNQNIYNTSSPGGDNKIIEDNKQATLNNNIIHDVDSAVPVEGAVVNSPDNNQQQPGPLPPQENVTAGAAAAEGASPSSSTADDQQQRPPQPVIPYVGLINPSCICYFNSLIQTLFHTPAFRHAVYSINSENEVLDDSLPKSLQNVFYDLGNANGVPQSIKQITVKALNWGPRDLSVQHDIQELFTKLRDAVEEHLNGQIDTLFTVFGENFIRALDDSYSRQIPERVHELILAIENFGQKANASLDEALDNHCAVDQLVGDNKLKVEQEGKDPVLKDAEKGYRYNRFAPIVFAHLSRFDWEQNKINNRFEFPKTLDLTKREHKIHLTEEDIKKMEAEKNTNMASAYKVGIKQQEEFPEVYGKDATDPDAIYELYAVIVHSGGYHHGHYTCNIRDAEVVDGKGVLTDRWYNYNDDVVSEITENNAIDGNYGGYIWYGGRQMLSSKNAYMLAYVRKSLVPKIFADGDISGRQTIPEKILREFENKKQEEDRQRKIKAEQEAERRRQEEENNRQCHITLVDDNVIADHVRVRQTELIDGLDEYAKNSPNPPVTIVIPKKSTIKALYEQVSQLHNNLPIDQFRLHWFEPGRKNTYTSHLRVGNTIHYSDSEEDIIETLCPGNFQVRDRPWVFRIYIELKKVQIAPVIRNVARGADFTVSSNEKNLNSLEDEDPAYPFCDNRMFQFDDKDVLTPKMECRLKKTFTIERVAFQCPLPENHHAVTRFDVKISVFQDDKLVHVHYAHHRNHTDHSVFYSDNSFVNPAENGPNDDNEPPKGPVRGNRVVFERVNVSMYDHFYPHKNIDPALADKWILSRLKIECADGELDPKDPLYTTPRFISEDIRHWHMAVKYYSYRTCRLEYKGYITVPIAEFNEVNLPVLRDVCGLDPGTKIRVFEESNGACEQLELARGKYWPLTRIKYVIDNILIVQEEPPADCIFMYEMPFASTYLRSLAGTRSIMFYSKKAPEEGTQAIISVPEYATHDMVAEELGHALNVPWDRIQLYGASLNYGVTLPKTEPFHSEESSLYSMIGNNREGILFYDILKVSLKQAESIMEVKCYFCDALGNRIAEEPFHREVPTAFTMLDLAELMTEHFGFPFEQSHVFVDIQTNVVENYALVLPKSAEKRGVIPAPIAGATQNAKSIANNMKIKEFFNTFVTNCTFELRPYPDADSFSQVYIITHGTFDHSKGDTAVTTTGSPLFKSPGFIAMPLTADVEEAYNIIKAKYELDDEDFQADPPNERLVIYVHRGLYFQEWDTKLQTYFFHTQTDVYRPKALLINYTHNKKRHIAKKNYVPSYQPALSLTKKKDETKEQGTKDGKDASTKDSSSNKDKK